MGETRTTQLRPRTFDPPSPGVIFAFAGMPRVWHAVAPLVRRIIIIIVIIIVIINDIIIVVIIVIILIVIIIIVIINDIIIIIIIKNYKVL